MDSTKYQYILEANIKHLKLKRMVMILNMPPKEIQGFGMPLTVL